MNNELFPHIEAYKQSRDMNHRYEIRWLGCFFDLIEYKSKFGHTKVPDTGSGPYKLLGNWVERQRMLYNSGAIDPAREKLLKMIDFNFRLRFYTLLDWNMMFERLKKFKNTFGHTNIPEKYEDRQLYVWISNQRKIYWKGKLEEKKLNKFLALGVEMQNKKKDWWESKFERLVNFKKEHGHFHVSKHYTSDKQLMNFVGVLRRSKTIISQEKIEALNSIGFDWNPGRKAIAIVNVEKKFPQWLKNYEELKAYKERFGDCRVTRDNKEYHQLGIWVQNQRKREKGLSDKKRQLLSEIGFFEVTPENRWNENFKKLVSFKKQHGHLFASATCTNDTQFLNFVDNTRHFKNRLSEENIKRLDSIGFPWRPGKESLAKINQKRGEEIWLKHYEELKVYYQKYGTCHISVNNIEFPSLGQWVYFQRKNKELSDEKRTLLVEIGFFDDFVDQKLKRYDSQQGGFAQ